MITFRRPPGIGRVASTSAHTYEHLFYSTALAVILRQVDRGRKERFYYWVGWDVRVSGGFRLRISARGMLSTAGVTSREAIPDRSPGHAFIGIAHAGGCRHTKVCKLDALVSGRILVSLPQPSPPGFRPSPE